MRVLIVKLSSLGDLVHLFPALTDACEARPDVEFGWAVDAQFTAVSRLHPAIQRVHPIPLRRWRSDILGALAASAVGNARAQLAGPGYDLVIDAQGLIKSAWVASWARAPVAGFHRSSARESLATLGYRRHIRVDRGQHAVDRLRQLLAAALDYQLPSTAPGAGLAPPGDIGSGAAPAPVMLLHGTTWATKEWPEAHWRALAEHLRDQRLLLPWGTTAEARRAQRIAAGLDHVEVLPSQSLETLISQIWRVAAVVGVDSGLLHVAAAGGVPTVGLYGATSPRLTGPVGPQVTALAADLPCAPCQRRRCHLQPARGADQWPPCLAALEPTAVARRLRSQLGLVA